MIELLSTTATFLLGALCGVLFIGAILAHDQIKRWREDGFVDPASE